MASNWILSANASRARFFSQAQSGALDEINDMINDAARMRTSETAESDKRGPTAASKSVHNTGGAVPNKLYEPPVTPDEHEAELFARDIAEYLLKSHRQGRFQQLTLVVSPQFLGMLRKMLDPGLESAVTLEIDKDYTHFDARQLLEQIQDRKGKD